MRGEGVAGFAGDVAGAGVVVAYRVFDLFLLCLANSLRWFKADRDGTHVHVEGLAIASTTTDCRGDNYQLVFCDEIAYAALFALRLGARTGLDVEFEGGDQGKEEGQEELHCEGQPCL